MPRGHIYSDLEWNFIGLTYWMDAHRELAIDYWRYTTRLLSANRVAYSLQGGGIETGLLLWFGALAIRSREARRHAAYRKHLAQAAPRKASTEVYEFYNVVPYFVAKHELDARGR
ncbi:MAG TPA: hypothetical protein VJ783_22210 [Pirellulales bacterium]|nr:hypothetical protein [Pirellulales bacterium]